MVSSFTLPPSRVGEHDEATIAVAKVAPSAGATALPQFKRVRFGSASASDGSVLGRHALNYTNTLIAAAAALETPPRFKVTEKMATLRGKTAGASHCPPELREWTGNKTAGIKNSITRDDGTANKKTCKYDGRASNGDKKGKPCADAIQGIRTLGLVSSSSLTVHGYCCPEGCLPAWMDIDDKAPAALDGGALVGGVPHKAPPVVGVGLRDPGVLELERHKAPPALETPPRFKVTEKMATLRGKTAGASHCPPELREWTGNKTAGIKNSITQDDGTANKKTCKYDGRASNGDKKGKPCADATRDSVVHGHCCPEGCLPAWMGVDDY
jgi:hypothetical protein